VHESLHQTREREYARLRELVVGARTGLSTRTRAGRSMGVAAAATTSAGARSIVSLTGATWRGE